MPESPKFEGKKGQDPPDETELYTTPGESDQSSDPVVDYLPLQTGFDLLQQRFELLAELGRGGMGTVFKAKDKITGDLIGLKVLNTEIAHDPAYIERFKNELILARKITHKNICRIFDLHQFGPTAAITMEFVEGRSLREVLKISGGLTVRKGLDVTEQILAGLEEAHRQGVIHRDLKPENIMLTSEGHIKIMDFGIARSATSDTVRTQGAIGTPAYMSPEQTEGKKVDHRTDIYSVGIILFELFTGELTFSGETPASLAYHHVHTTPRAPKQIESALPAYIQDVILKCLSKDPRKRYQEICDVRHDLKTKRDEHSALADDTFPLSSDMEDSSHQLSFVDLILFGGLVLGLGIFFFLREGIFPAHRLRITIDNAVAGQLAKEFTEDLELSEFDTSTGHIIVWPWDSFLWRYGRKATVENFETWQPIRWKIVTRSAASNTNNMFNINALTGEFVGFKNEVFRATGPVPESQPIQKQAFSRSIVLLEKAFGMSPNDVRVTSESLGIYEGRWDYLITMDSRYPLAGTREYFSVAIWADEVFQLSREQLLIDEPQDTEKYTEFPTVWVLIKDVLTAIFAVLTLILFRRRVFIGWKSTLIFSTLYTIAYVFTNIPDQGELGDYVDTIVYQGMLFPVSFLWISGVKVLLAKYFPSKFITFFRAWTGSASRLDVGQSILRGFAFGFIMLGVFSVVVEFGMESGFYWFTPEIILAAVTSVHPPLTALSWAFVISLSGTIMGIALPACIIKARTQSWMLIVLGVGIFNSLMLYGHGGATLLPWPATMVWTVLLGASLATIFLNHDLLTVFVSLLTLSICVISIPILIMFNQVLPFASYLPVIILMTILLGGCWAYWGLSVRERYQRIVESFE